MLASEECYVKRNLGCALPQNIGGDDGARLGVLFEMNGIHNRGRKINNEIIVIAPLMATNHKKNVF